MAAIHITLVLLVNLFLLLTVLADVCTTPGCRKASSDVLSFIDPSIDPCEDFYKFTCSGIFKKTLESKPASLAAITEKEVEDQINILLIKPINPEEPKAIQGLKKFFRSCMDEAAIERDGANTIKRVLRQLGGWPVVDGPKWNENKFNTEELLIRLRRIGYNFKQLLFVRTTSGEDDQMFVVDIPVIKNVKNKNKEGYHDIMIDTAVLLGADRQAASSEMQETLLFKMKLLRIIDRTEEYNKTTIRNVQANFPILNWKRFINNIIFPNDPISEDQELYFPSNEYLTRLDNLLQETSKRTLANYILWEAVEEVREYLPNEFREISRRYISPAVKRASIGEDNKTRLEFCKAKSRVTLRPTLEAMYVREHFSFERRQKAQELVASIREELIELLNTTDLFDSETRIRVLERANDIKYNIGAPDRVFDEHLFPQLFEEREKITSNDFLTVASVLSKQSANLDLRLGASIDYYGSFYEETLLPKILYASYENTMTLSAAALQGLYFNDKRPWYLNFGSIGTVLGQTLTHGFTQDGNNNDNSSDKDDLWTTTTKTNFKNNAACLIHEASDFKIDDSELRMDGNQVHDESIRDHTGVKIAYQAYDNWLKIHGEEKQLPGLNYTPKQLFWISAASAFCDTVSLDKLRDFIQNQKKAHPTFRTFEAFSNSEHFGKDFNCPVGSRMNPSHKCKIF